MTEKIRDWIVVHSGFEKFECLRCGDTYRPGMPCPLPMMLAAMNEYKKMHKGCKAKKEKEQS